VAYWHFADHEDSWIRQIAAERIDHKVGTGSGSDRVVSEMLRQSLQNLALLEKMKQLCVATQSQNRER